MYSEVLAEMDRNTVMYMCEDMQNQNNDMQNTIRTQKNQLAQKDTVIAEKDKMIEKLQARLKEKNKES